MRANIMDYSSLENLKLKQLEGIEKCEEKIEQWKKFSSDYDDLDERLIKLPDKVSYDVMIPFCGKAALIPGKMVHTNEIMVLLGEDYLVQRSAKQASEIAQRRKNYCNEMIDMLKEEKNQFQNWFKATTDVQCDQGIEIKENYDEDKEKSWRKEHVIRVKQSRIASTKEECKVSDEKSTKTDSEIWARLEDLEKFENEMDSNLSEKDLSSEEDASDTSSVTSDSKENSTPTKKVCWEEDKVSSQTSNIYFRHSETKTLIGDEDVMDPADISRPDQILSKHLQSLTFNKKPLKSCLKQSVNESIPIINEDDSYTKRINEEKASKNPSKSNIHQNKFEAFNLAFSGEIKERSIPEADIQNTILNKIDESSKTTKISEETKPISRFKAKRMKK